MQFSIVFCYVSINKLIKNWYVIYKECVHLVVSSSFCFVEEKHPFWHIVRAMVTCKLSNATCP